MNKIKIYFVCKMEEESIDIIEIAQEILFWFNTFRRNYITISSNKIIAYAIKLFGKDFKNSYNSYRWWIQRFLVRNNWSIRKKSHEGNRILKNIENLTYKFLTECINKWKSTQINVDIECINNIYIENPGKDIVDIKDKKKLKLFHLLKRNVVLY